MARMDMETRQAYAACAKAIVEGRMDLDGADASGFSVDEPVFNVTQTAQLVLIHPQTLRQYDRVGLVVASRTEGGSRRYTLRDIDRIMASQHLIQDEGVNLSGVAHILELMEENRQLRRQIRRMKQPAGASIFAAGMDGEVVEVLRSNRERARAMARAAGLMDDSASADSGSGASHEAREGGALVRYRVCPVRGRFLPVGAAGGLVIEITDGEDEGEEDGEGGSEE